VVRGAARRPGCTGELDPGCEELIDTAVEEAGDLVEIGVPCTAGVFETLRQLATVDVPFDLYDVNASFDVECDDVGYQSLTYLRLAGDWEQG
jgi:hypothetical protein